MRNMQKSKTNAGDIEMLNNDFNFVLVSASNGLYFTQFSGGRMYYSKYLKRARSYHTLLGATFKRNDMARFDKLIIKEIK